MAQSLQNHSSSAFSLFLWFLLFRLVVFVLKVLLIIVASTELFGLVVVLIVIIFLFFLDFVAIDILSVEAAESWETEIRIILTCQRGIFCSSRLRRRGYQTCRARWVPCTSSERWESQLFQLSCQWARVEKGGYTVLDISGLRRWFWG